MKKALAITILGSIIIICTFISGFPATKIVGEMTGRSYNDVWESWDEEPLYVYVDHEGRTYIGGGSIFTAKAYFTDEERLEIIRLLEKGLEWSAKAREKQVELTKPLGSIKFLIDDFSDHYNGIDLVFFAANNAKQTDIIITIYDFDNMFFETELYLENERVKQLISILNNVPSTIEKLLEEQKIADEFQ